MTHRFTRDLVDSSESSDDDDNTPLSSLADTKAPVTVKKNEESVTVASSSKAPADKKADDLNNKLYMKKNPPPTMKQHGLDAALKQIDASLRKVFGHNKKSWPQIARVFANRSESFFESQESWENALWALHLMVIGEIDCRFLEDEDELIEAWLAICCRLFRMYDTQIFGHVFVHGDKSRGYGDFPEGCAKLIDGRGDKAGDSPYTCFDMLFDDYRSQSVPNNLEHYAGKPFDDLNLGGIIAKIEKHTEELWSYTMQLLACAVPGRKLVLKRDKRCKSHFFYVGMFEESAKRHRIAVEGVKGMNRYVAIAGNEKETLPKDWDVKKWSSFFRKSLCPQPLVIQMTPRKPSRPSFTPKRSAGKGNKMFALTPSLKVKKPYIGPPARPTKRVRWH